MTSDQDKDDLIIYVAGARNGILQILDVMHSRIQAEMPPIDEDYLNEIARMVEHYYDVEYVTKHGRLPNEPRPMPGRGKKSGGNNRRKKQRASVK